MSGNPANWAEYRKHNNYVHNGSKKKFSQYMNEAFNIHSIYINDHPNNFGDLIRSGKGSIPPEVNYDGTCVKKSNEKAELFNNLFHSSFNSSSYDIPPP